MLKRRAGVEAQDLSNSAVSKYIVSSHIIQSGHPQLVFFHIGHHGRRLSRRAYCFPKSVVQIILEECETGEAFSLTT